VKTNFDVNIISFLLQLQWSNQINYNSTIPNYVL